MSNWESSRQRQYRKERTATTIRVAFVLIVVALAYSVSFKPLPVNLESLALSRGAMKHLEVSP